LTALLSVNQWTACHDKENPMKALVLAGGGVAGIAWELGVLLGLEEAAPGLFDDLLTADLIVGTSAGASVAAQVTSGVPLDELYEAQLRPETAEIEVEFDMAALLDALAAIAASVSEPAEGFRHVGQLALAATTVEPALRQAAIDARLPVKTWPQAPLLVTAVNADSGEFVAFSAESGVTLLDAVTASCAVPGIWPPVPINGHPYIDGGVRSMTNAQLAAGSDAVVVLRPAQPPAESDWLPADEAAALVGAALAVIDPDAASLSAFGTNPLSPLTRAASAQAGRALGVREAARVAAIWR
jgi:NTE family protein